jgi:predicted GNAT family N-acyltransferase
LKRHFTIHIVSWQTHAQALSELRETVFIQEQQVPIALEWDGLDEIAQHLIALNDTDEPIGCARLIGDGSIGRMAVLKPWRNQGVGMALLKQAIILYQLIGIHHITLSAQMHAVKFYEKAGFTVCSEPYLDAGIAHVDMALSA